VLSCGQHGESVLFVFDRFLQNLCDFVLDGTSWMLFVCYLFVICFLFYICLLFAVCLIYQGLSISLSRILRLCSVTATGAVPLDTSL
jgi:hypothetical protein